MTFDVAKGLIDNELTSLTTFYNEEPAYTFDEDLANYWNQFEESLGRPNRNGITQARWLVHLRDHLKSQLKGCCELWMERMRSKNDFRADVMEVYGLWRGIEPFLETGHLPDEEVRLVEDVRIFLLQPGTHHPDLSQWQLLKASMTFKDFHSIHTNFTWQMAGRQLQFIKAMRSSACVGAPTLVVPRLYTALRPDNKYIKRIVARAEGRGGAGDGDDDGGFLDDEDEDDDLDVFEDAEEFVGADYVGLESAVRDLCMSERRRH